MRFDLLSRPLRVRWEHRASQALGPAQANDKLCQQDKLEGTYITDIPQSQPTQLFAMWEDSLFCCATITEAERVSGILRHSVDANASVVSMANQRSGWCVPFTPGVREAFVTGRVSCEKPDDDGHTHRQEWSTTQTRYLQGT
jgi:hypothetical protein